MDRMLAFGEGSLGKGSAKSLKKKGINALKLAESVYGRSDIIRKPKLY
jgi:hypothetical protein